MAAAASFSIRSECLPINRSAAFESKIVDGIRDLVLVLAVDGRVLNASHTCLELTDNRPEDMLGEYVTSFMHHDELPEFLVEFRDCMALGGSWRFFHRIRKRYDTFAPFESTFRPFVDTSIAQQAGLPAMPMCLMISRPYVSAPTTLMDSFLEHWTKNIQLSNQLTRLQNEDGNLSDDSILTATTVEEVVSQSITPNANSKRVRFDMADDVKIETDQKPTECLTHLHQSSPPVYLPPRSSDSTISGDVGIQIKTSRLQVVQNTGVWPAKPRLKNKNKKPKEYVCRECGRADSPEWRKGPMGPKTLCNACGLRWSKSNKKSDS